MIESRIKSLMLRDNRSTLNVKSSSNGYTLIRMLLKMSMRKREKSSRLSIIQLLKRSMDNKDKDSQVLVHRISKEVKDSQELEPRVISRVIRELISMILTEVNNFKQFIFYKILFIFKNNFL